MSFICNTCGLETMNPKDVTPESEERCLCKRCYEKDTKSLNENLSFFGLTPANWRIEPDIAIGHWFIVHKNNKEVKLKGISMNDKYGRLVFKSINMVNY